jgi:hypothetical protein
MSKWVPSTPYTYKVPPHRIRVGLKPLHPAKAHIELVLQPRSPTFRIRRSLGLATRTRAKAFCVLLSRPRTATVGLPCGKPKSRLLFVGNSPPKILGGNFEGRVGLR